MYPTEEITVQELVARMRMMNEGDEIGLAKTSDGEYSFGIRCLPGGIFDNGMCWLADYYGGGSTMAFSETELEFMSESDKLLEAVWDWLARVDLLSDIVSGGSKVYVQIKDGTLPETKWEFKATKVEPKNRLVCVNFDLRRPYHTYVSVPPALTDEEIKRITKVALKTLSPEEFKKRVYATAEALDPFIDDEDFVCMEVDPCFNQQNAFTTDLPTGTIGR